MFPVKTVLLAVMMQCLMVTASWAAEPAGRAKIGAYYFDGWSGQTDRTHLPERLKTEFAARQPIWGWYDNTVAIMQQQIDLAADHGIRFFAFCWYWPEGASKTTPNNNALSLFRQAPNRDRMEFCLLVANHKGYRIGPKDWETVTDRWVELFKDPRHLKVDGKPLLIIFSPGELNTAFGNPGKVHEALDRLRQKAAAAGIKEICVAACCTPRVVKGRSNLKDLEAAGYDLFTAYNYAGAGAVDPGKQQKYENLVAGCQKIWETFAQEATIPYLPLVNIGWDKRPWEKPEQPEKHSVFYPDRTPQAVGQAVSSAIDWLDRHPDKTLRERLVLLYAWNENGEGGYLTPTQADGDAYLKAVQAAVSAPR